MAENYLVKLPLDVNLTLLMIGLHWLRLWLGVVKKQAITWDTKLNQIYITIKRHKATVC